MPAAKAFDTPARQFSLTNPYPKLFDEQETMGDSQLTDRVHSVLRDNPHVPHRNLRFEAHQGQVVLRGVVRSYYQKLMAQEALLGLEGVETVENQLEVEWR